LVEKLGGYLVLIDRADPSDNQHEHAPGASMNNPTRIQLRRTKGWRLPEGAISVSRPSAWGNPFRVGHEASVAVYPPGHGADGWDCAMPITHQLAVDLIRAWILARPAQVDEIRTELAGHDLACWCPLDQPCHADVLLEIANGYRA
jgi:hypothetical protein